MENDLRKEILRFSEIGKNSKKVRTEIKKPGMIGVSAGLCKISDVS